MSTVQDRLARTAFGCAALASLLATGCATAPVSFLHKEHRGAYALVEQDLERMQFFISREVLAHRVGEDGTTSPDDVVILDMRTRGKVVEVGPNWLRVAFQAKGVGAVFLASGTGADSLYKLASEGEGRPGYSRVQDMEDPILMVEGQRYRVIRGAQAYLLIEEVDLKRVVADRAHLRGAKP